MSATLTTPTTRDRIIAAANDLPSLLAAAETQDPALATALTGKALAASKTVYGSAAVLLITWAVGKLGLGWGADTITLIAGGLVLVGLRVITSGPITGLFRKGPTQ